MTSIDHKFHENFYNYKINQYHDLICLHLFHFKIAHFIIHAIGIELAPKLRMFLIYVKMRYDKVR